jgi:MGT family glycosyltransferase
MNALRLSLGLPADPDGAMLFRYLYLLNEPLAFQPDAEELPPTTLRCRRVVFDQSSDEQLPGWLTDLGCGPTVYATAGTMVNRTPGLLERFLEALRDEPVSLILTIGRDRDPAEFGPQPPNVHIAPYIPQSLVLAMCDLVLSHCGSGTMYAALAHGLPMVNVPVGMDQPENAARCARLKLGLTVDPTTGTADEIREAVCQVLTDPVYRTNAQRVQQAMQALPGPSDVAAVLERLATDRQPFSA